MAPRHYSRKSKLTDLFAERAGVDQQTPEETMLELIGRLRRSARAKRSEVPFDKYLSLRNVANVSYRRDLGHDGQIEPMGTTYADGFQIVLDGSARGSRSRFTLAHELCHTFFYEYAPEIKFLPHTIDSEEERLCNLGAAELLMPATLVRRAVKEKPACLKTLDDLASLFHVSLEAMVLRLIQLKLWQVELSSWIRLTNGKFAIDRIVGGKVQDWQWPDTSQLAEAWQSGKPCSGQHFLRHTDRNGTSSVRPIRFDLARRQSRICILWGMGVVGSNRIHESPLFETKPKFLAKRGRAKLEVCAGSAGALGLAFET
jgi:Zn-dependent peptidase ImmA (M78 family)